MKFWLTATLAAVALCVWLFFTPSYRLSREADAALKSGDFAHAIELASQALHADPYNRLAFAVQSQATQRANIASFLENAKQIQERVSEILGGGAISPDEFLRLKWAADEFKKSSDTLTFFNNPNPAEREQIESFREWFAQLELRLKSAHAAPKSTKAK